MLEYDGIDFSKGVDDNKTDCLGECIICHYWYFLEINFEFQPEVCNGGHDLMQKVMSFNDVAIVSIKRNNCRNHFLYMSKDEATNLFKIC